MFGNRHVIEEEDGADKKEERDSAETKLIL